MPSFRDDAYVFTDRFDEQNPNRLFPNVDDEQPYPEVLEAPLPVSELG